MIKLGIVLGFVVGWLAATYATADVEDRLGLWVVPFGVGLVSTMPGWIIAALIQRMLPKPPMTRERWLQRLVISLRPELKRLAGITVPAVMISADPVTWRNRALRGFCNYDGDGRGIPTINIAPNVTDPIALAEVVAHEMLHAGLPWAGHDWTFRETAQRIDLTVHESGATSVTAAFRAWVSPLVGQLGPYPSEDADLPQPVSLPVDTGSIAASVVVLAGLCSLYLVGPALVTDVIVAAGLTTLAMTHGLTDSYLAENPRRRIAWQIFILIGPGVIALIIMAPFFSWALTAPQQALSIMGMVNAGLGAIVLHDMLNGQRLGFTYAPLIMAIWCTYVALATPIALYLWWTRPIIRYYQHGSFRAPTPAFAQVPWKRGGLRLSRSNPRHVGEWLSLVELAARAERARRGLPVVGLHGIIEAELLPNSGFVIERHGNVIEVASGVEGNFPPEVAKQIHRDLKWATGKRGSRFFQRLPLMSPTIITVRAADAGSAQKASRGASFAYPKGS